jgi:hypothetical protein
MIIIHIFFSDEESKAQSDLLQVTQSKVRLSEFEYMQYVSTAVTLTRRARRCGEGSSEEERDCPLLVV